MQDHLIIESVEIYQSPVPLWEPFVISLGPLEFADNVVVVIRTDKGITGFGECSPFRMIHGESMETCFLVAQYLAKDLKGKDPLELEKCIRQMDNTI
jgi:L-alanine-DL-glutamate epimerase-like enolase superfamily enzyme